MTMNTRILSQAAHEARGLAIDAVHACASGHLGLPLGTAEIGAVLFGDILRYDPAKPRWLNRDRLVLSAGHGSMFLYSWLHLAGYDVSIDDVKNFRKMGSPTPGHPEFGETPGVECTSGPLGQGIGSAVGMAIAEKLSEATLNANDCLVFDYHVYALAGDGCIQEGITHEACAMAGHYGLDNFILIYDSNDVTLDAMADETQSEDTEQRFKAYGFDVVTIDGHDLEAIRTALAEARDTDNGRPKLIIAKTEIARGIPEVAGTAKGHGEGGYKFAESARRGLGLPDEPFYVSDEVKAYFSEYRKKLSAARQAWEKVYDCWRETAPALAQQLDAALSKNVPSDLLAQIPAFSEEASPATRAAGGEVIQHIAKALPLFVSGSADLHGSTKNYIEDVGDFSRENRAGRNFRFGIREHGMAAVCNGIAYDGLFRPSCATFLVFSDYCRPSIRVAALSKLPVVYLFTHDSVGVGEDGPTHQPVEHLAALRAIPNLDVIRPADAEETAGAYAAAIQRTDGPTLIAMTRQNVPMLTEISVEQRRNGVEKGAYIARKEAGTLETLLISCGSELQIALKAADELGPETRVVSMPCMERFSRQPAEYQESVLPADCRKRVAVDAGVSDPWYRWVGMDGRIVALDRFGMSAPFQEILEKVKLTPDAVVAAAREL